jgi:hypothetical protein
VNKEMHGGKKSGSGHRRRPFAVEEGRPLGRRCVCQAARCRKVAIGRKSRSDKKATRRVKVAPQIVVA